MTTIGQTLFLLLSSELLGAFGSFAVDVDYRVVEKDLHKVMVDNQSFWPGET